MRTDGLAAHPRARRLVGELGRLPSVRRLDLSPFDAAEVADYLALLDLGGLDARPAGEIADEVFRRTGGNAYFVATVAADLARTGSMGEGVPPALADLLLGRLERLPDPVRTVVRCASITSQPVSDRLLRRVAGLDDTSVDEALRLAVAEGLLVPEGTGYGFPHDLLRAAVHDDLLPGERARLHAARAAALASGRDATASPAEIAHHFAEAGDAPEVLVWSVRAAEEAMRVQAPQEALDHLERALAVWPGVDEAARAGLREGRLAVQAARAAGLAGEPTRSIEWGRRAVLLVRRRGRRRRGRGGAGRAGAPAGRGRCLARGGPARRGCRAPRRGAGRRPGSRGARRGRARPGAAARSSTRRRTTTGRERRRRGRAAQDPALEVEALTTIAFLDEVDGDRDAAAHRLDTALRLARAAREPGAELRAHYSLASMYYYDGDVTAALPVLRTAMTRVAESGLRWSEPGIELRLLHAIALYVNGDLEGSLRAADAPEHRPPDVAAARLAAVSCYAAVAAGRPDAAARVARLRDSWDTDPQVALVAGGCEADLLIWAGDPGGAVDVAERAQSHLDAAIGEGAYGGLWLSALALAGLADQAAAGRARRDDAAVAEAVRRGEVLRGRVERLVTGGHGRPGDLGTRGARVAPPRPGRVRAPGRRPGRRGVAACARVLRLRPRLRAGPLPLAAVPGPGRRR